MPSLPDDHPAPLAPLDYHRPANQPDIDTARVSRTVSALRNVFLTAFAATIMLLILGGVVPRLDTTFRSFDIKLPLVTRIILAASRLFVSTWMWITGPAIVIALSTCAALLPLPRRALRALILVILIVVILTLALGVLLPLVDLTTSLTTSGAKP
jgi:type II secretory pathway component PulF